MNFREYLRPGVRVYVYKHATGTNPAMFKATVVKVNRQDLTVITDEGERKRVELAAVADLAPGERARAELEADRHV